MHGPLFLPSVWSLFGELILPCNYGVYDSFGGGNGWDILGDGGSFLGSIGIRMNDVNRMG